AAGPSPALLLRRERARWYATSAGHGPEKRAIRGMLATARVRCPDRRAFLPMQVLACRETPGKREFGLDPFPWTGGRFRLRGGGPSRCAADELSRRRRAAAP